MPATAQTWTYVFNLKVMVHAPAPGIAHSVIESSGDLAFNGQMTADGLRDRLIAETARRERVSPEAITVVRFTSSELPTT